MLQQSTDRLKVCDRRRVGEFVTGNTGIQLPESKHSLIESRLRKRQRALGLASLSDYVDFVFTPETGDSEKVHLLDALTTNKTDFYREPNHFGFLRHTLIEELQQDPYKYANRPYSVWSAGCSSGEEPYTLAIELSEIKKQYSNFNFRIFATDISVSSIEKARAGIYTLSQIQPIPAALRSQYLYRSKDREKQLVAISPQIRSYIKFCEFNLLGSSYPAKQSFDLIFCRNVMIYFNDEDRVKIASRFHRTLKSTGIYIIGHSETLSGNQDLFHAIQPTIYRAKVNSKTVSRGSK